MNKYNFFSFKLLAIAVIFWSSATTLFAGEVYKWTDKSGVIHYSDIKPANVESKSIKVKAGKPSGSRSDPQEQASALDETKSQQLADQAKKLQASASKRENEARCQTLRDNLVKFKENSRIKINVDGEIRYLTPEEISSKTIQYEKMLSEECS